jgi:hypothetical protein
MRTKSNTIGAYMRLSSSAKQCISTEREGAALRTCARLGAERGELLGRGNGASYRSSAFVLCHSKPIKPSRNAPKTPKGVLDVCVCLQEHQTHKTCHSSANVLLKSVSMNLHVRELPRGWNLHTVLAVQIRDTEDVKLATHRCGESAADTGLASDELANRGKARVDGGGGGEAQESGEGGECELHRDFCGGLRKVSERR